MKYLAFITSLTCALNTWASCNPDLPLTTPDSQFELRAGGAMVRDNKTGLIWQRCTAGFVWDMANNRCTISLGASISTWSAALSSARLNRLGGFSNWRLPNKKELASLIEYSCTQPAINSRIFPNTPSGYFWTSTPVNYADSFNVWYVNFTAGDYGSLDGITHFANTRLVRDDE
ncbi:MAG TPA: DUF1566 domain-containing protein [Cellvibrionaceae bacterium]|nr:DUF1566 domain-containing protein [Cellvibrionaceae bacterium]